MWIASVSSQRGTKNNLGFVGVKNSHRANCSVVCKQNVTILRNTFSKPFGSFVGYVFSINHGNLTVNNTVCTDIWYPRRNKLITPKDYTAADFRRDQDIFHKWVRENYPECAIIGPSDTDPNAMSVDADGNPHPWADGAADTAGIAAALAYCSTADLMDGCEEKLDVFSYHYYNGVSERMAAMMPSAFTPFEGCMSEEYLGAAAHSARCFLSYRDKYATPGGQMWVTESGDAGAGGHTWASTYAEVVRTLNEIGSFATVTDGVIFHNTLASSDYGWLKHGTFVPRPSYFSVLLWKKLMGNTCYASGEAIREGAHVFAHSRADGKPGVAYLVINNSWTETTTVELPADAEVYALTGNGSMRSRTMLLNGRELVLGEQDELPALEGMAVPAGKLEVAPGSCTFIVL